MSGRRFVMRAISAARSPLRTAKRVITRLSGDAGLDGLRGRLASGRVVIEELPIAPAFPIDIVYTWVNDEDPAFIDSLNAYLPPDAVRNRNTTSSARFKNHDELRYSLRSIERFAPWYNRIFIVTNGQRPSWVADHPRLTFVDHKEILAPEYLPTFNSHVIGSALHKIPGLSEHYIYFNDDVMLLRPVQAAQMFTFSGHSYAHISENYLGTGGPVALETATEWAAKNARDLLQREFGYHFDRRFTHMYHTQRKSIAEECEQLFAREYDTMRRNRFRQMNDLLCCSYLHHYVGYVRGTTRFTNQRGYYVRVRSFDAVRQFDAMLEQRDNPQGRTSVCLNDYEPPDGGNPDYQRELNHFLDSYYPTPSTFERAGA